jgi:hypothetical protein
MVDERRCARAFSHSLAPSKSWYWVLKPYTRSGDLDPETGSAGAEKGCLGVFSLV